MSNHELLCNVCYATSITMVIILGYLLSKLNEYKYSLDPFDLIKLYELDDKNKKHTLASNIQIRKNDGKTCGITSVFEGNVLKTTEIGDCLGKEKTITKFN